MIGRSIVDTTVRSSAATNTLKPTTARIADGRWPCAHARLRAEVLNHRRSVPLSARRSRTLAGGSIVERVAVVVELERPLRRAAVDRRLELGGGHEVRVGVDPEVDGDVLALHQPDGDVADLLGGRRAGDVVALAPERPANYQPPPPTVQLRRRFNLQDQDITYDIVDDPMESETTALPPSGRTARNPSRARCVTTTSIA